MASPRRATRSAVVPLVPLTKAARQARIVELLEASPVSSQTELGRLLAIFPGNREAQDMLASLQK